MATEQEADRYDEELRVAWSTLAEKSLDETVELRLGLPVRLGGVGVQWASARHHAARWSGWTALAGDEKENAGAETLAELRDKLPHGCSRWLGGTGDTSCRRLGTC